MKLSERLHSETETYAWGVLQGGEQPEVLVQGLARELAWLQEALR